MSSLRAALAASALAAVALAASAQEKDPAARPPGSQLPVASREAIPLAWKKGDRIVATYYFYWYCADSKEHLLNGDGSDALTEHPARLEGLSYRRPEWHRRELQDMVEAGIDVAMPVYWGVPGRHEEWSVVGVKAMVEALQGLAREGKRAPRVALFFDTTTLDKVDLTSEPGRLQLYRTVRDFFSLVPPALWATLDGRPIVWLYSSHFPSKVDARAFAFLRESLGRDFAGADPFVVGDRGWDKRAGAKVVDAHYSWGAALAGPRLGPLVAAVGPGYDDRAVPGRTTPRRAREGGRFYERSWLSVLRSPASIVAVETWNEFHEGTQVCESKEHGRATLEATRRFADMFHKGGRPEGPFSEAREVAWVEGSAKGLRAIAHEDGLFSVRDDGVLVTQANRFGTTRYVYLGAEDSFASFESADFDLTLELLDEGKGRLRVQASTADVDYSDGPAIALEGSGAWKSTTVRLRRVVLRGAQNAGADLRLAVEGRDVSLRRVVLARAR